MALPRSTDRLNDAVERDPLGVETAARHVAKAGGCGRGQWSGSKHLHALRQHDWREVTRSRVTSQPDAIADLQAGAGEGHSGLT